MKCEECKYFDKTERICYYMGENRCVDNEQQTEDAISRQAVLALPRNKIRNFKGEVVNETINVTDIETLPSVNPQEQRPCEDCISRQAAIDAVNIGNLHPGIVGALQSILADLPPVTPKQEPCEDAISRQAVEEIINDIRDCISVEGYWVIFERMKKLPPANSQEPKTGHWIFHTDASGNSWHTCPACGHVAYTLTRFCPDCGTRLEAPS